MKQKLKNLEVARKKGPSFVRKTIKKLLMEDITEPRQFFYDTEFDYEGDEGKKPLLFIGEIPTKWKKYVKANKTSKTLAAGRCIFDVKTQQLSLEAKIGKGAKPLVLKVLHKEVLKPFAKPQFVDSVENPTVLALDSTEEGDTAVEQAPDPQDKNTVPFDATSYIQEVEKAIKQANDILTQNAPLVTTLSSSLSNLKKKIISMDFIKESIENFNKLGDLGVSMRYITSLLAFGAELSKENDVNAQIQLLKTNQEALTKQKDEIVTFESKINDLNMISDDGTEDVELISSEPILDFFSKVSKLFA